ncbi:S-adenosylmethionine mitochondrial carrier protein-like [Biomphalaria glabrata]|uniref:S-adenosylmethionine mitochondrial carrier protein-like n=1 Tax=Biomphalaria glabrata TaxID=6526 RepID=A0A9U8E7A3_BIOGL|nr:S-adenosylmethionine mitochondrial carrier protein-like [Biomphalaria glabrata]
MEEFVAEKTQVPFKVALLAGGAAGTAVDVILFPLDTIKTRLQSEAGFIKSGGIRGVYSGLLSAALGSAPGAALFFVAYETSKSIYGSLVQHEGLQSIGHMMAATLGEVTACLVRVPVEVVKQRTQVFSTSSSLESFRYTMRSEGLKGFYRGYASTVMREVPFSVIQFPLWELMKSKVSEKTGQPVTAWQSSICGAVAGGTSAAITTPLDVAKTRIILAKKGSTVAKGDIGFVLRQVIHERGLPGLFSGMVPRVVWISIGGSIFLGVYEKVKIWASSVLK